MTTRDPETHLHTLPNGVRVLTLVQPWLDIASLSVFVRSGSQHESRRLNGISHVAEHMAFKGTATRDCQRINLDAERLGAEVNAHTDKDHTAFHMHGLAQHAPALIGMLGDIVLNSSFPADELERERQVILQEYAEDEDDPLSNAYKLFDVACWGEHPIAQPVIGLRANIRRFSREDLLAHVQRQYSGSNVIVAACGAIDPQQIVRAAEAAFAAMPPGQPNTVEAPRWIGGCRHKRHAGIGQSHALLGYPIPSLQADDAASQAAAAVFGEGMSSPLLDELRERRGLVYYANCSAEPLAQSGQFVIEASTAPEHLSEFFTEVGRLLRAQAEGVKAVDLERARNQILVRLLRTQEKPFQQLETAAQDVFVHGRVRARSERIAAAQALGAEQVRSAFERLLAAPPAIAVVGKYGSAAQAATAALAGTPGVVVV